mgnify:CR=1 FL=1
MPLHINQALNIKKKGLINCPICDDKRINKSIMKPNVSKKSNSQNNKKKQTK